MAQHFIPLNCLNCGGQLDVYDDMERFACGFCGTGMIVQRRGGTVSLKSVEEAIHKVQIGTDKTAAELALVRLNEELKKLTDDERLVANSTSALSLMVIAWTGFCVGIMVPIEGSGSSGSLLFGLSATVGSAFLFRRGWKSKERSDQRLTALRQQIAYINTHIEEQRKIVTL